MLYSKRSFIETDKDSLVQIVLNLQLKLMTKNAELVNTRTKLNTARLKIIKMEDILRFQRGRILELYPSELISK